MTFGKVTFKQAKEQPFLDAILLKIGQVTMYPQVTISLFSLGYIRPLMKVQDLHGRRIMVSKLKIYTSLGFNGTRSWKGRQQIYNGGAKN